MNIKKILIGIFAFAITASLFAGCNRQAEELTNSSSSEQSSSSSVEESSSSTTESSSSTSSETKSESEVSSSSTETESNPATEQSTGTVNEADYQKEAENWYESDKNIVSCNKETYVKAFIDYRKQGLGEIEAASNVRTDYVRYNLTEPEDSNNSKHEESKPTSSSKPTESKPEESKPTESSKPTENSKPTESSKPTETKPSGYTYADGSVLKDVNGNVWAKPVITDATTEEDLIAPDYTNIKWGDPLPEKVVNKLGVETTVIKWVEEPGGKFVMIRGSFYYSIQDWAERKSFVSMDVVNGTQDKPITDVEWS